MLKYLQKIHLDIVFCVREAAGFYKTFPGMSVSNKIYAT
jgi:hypothetical protein